MCRLKLYFLCFYFVYKILISLIWHIYNPIKFLILILFYRKIKSQNFLRNFDAKYFAKDIKKNCNPILTLHQINSCCFWFFVLNNIALRKFHFLHHISYIFSFQTDTKMNTETVSSQYSVLLNIRNVFPSQIYKHETIVFLELIP